MENRNTILACLVQDTGFTLQESEEMLDEALLYFKKTVSSLMNDAKNHHLQAIKMPLHRIKGASANLRMKQFSQFVHDVELELEKNNAQAILKGLQTMETYITSLM